MKNDKKGAGALIGRIWSQYSFVFVLFIIMIGYAITINDIPDEDGVHHYEYLSKSAEISG